MNIPAEHLRRDFRRAHAWWGAVIDDAERRHRIPARLLYAIFSRETNMGRHWDTAPPATFPPAPTRDRLTYWIWNSGDGGNGHGIGQVDKGSHVIPSNWAGNIKWQVERSAEILSDYLRREGGNVTRGANRYNSGQGETRWTTGKDYGPDIVERWQLLVREFPSGPPAPPPPPADAWDARGRTVLLFAGD